MASLNHNFCVSERRIFLFDELDSSGKTGGGFWFARRVETATLWPPARLRRRRSSAPEADTARVLDEVR
jgi:hypothetical protein